MKGVYFALRFAEFRSRREAFADGLSIDLAGQTEVGSMRRLAGLMTMAVGFTASPWMAVMDPLAEITQLQDLGQDAGALLLRAGYGIRQRA
jgi:hypothetical protein